MKSSNRLASVLLVLILGWVAPGCSVVGTAAREAGDAAADTAEAAGDAAGTAAEGAGDVVGETADEAEDVIDDE